MNTKMKNYSTAITGFLLLASGLVMVKTSADPQGVLQVLPYVCIGVGCGIFGQGIGNVVSQKVYEKAPQVKDHIDIEQNDERNIAITNRAKAKSHDMMVFVFGALILSFALMGVDMVVLLLLVFAYLFVIFYGIYYRGKFEKEM